MNNLNKYIAVSTLVLSQAIVGCSSKTKAHNFVYSNSQKVDVILNNKSENQNNTSNYLNYTKSIEFVWKNEVDNFNDFFWLYDNNVNKFVEEIKSIQTKFWLNVDGILWPNTLKVVYQNYYANNIDVLNSEANKRLEIYMNMKWYDNVKWAYNEKLNVFSKNLYYGIAMWTNISGTYINENLANHFSERLWNRENKIIFSNVNGKTALAFYVGWKLEVATFVTPGINNSKYRTPPLVTNGKANPDKLHISSQFPEIKDENWSVVDSGWAVMPYAVHIDRGIWLHWSDSKIDWLAHSHWCVRVWLYYIEHIYRLVNQLWVSNVLIDTRNIY